MSNNLFELPDNISVDTIVKDRIGKVELSLEIDDALLLLRFLDSTTECENTRYLTTHIHEEIVNCLNNKNVS
tara:strand:- start:16666 stop:16881 length:216 start_codon:yes stop_codon:yes gene_type:complete